MFKYFIIDDLYPTCTFEWSQTSALITPHYEAKICTILLLDGMLYVEVKIFSFWPKTMDYSPWFRFWESEKSFEKSVPLYSKRKEKSNGACFSRIAPSSVELIAFKVFYSLYI